MARLLPAGTERVQNLSSTHRPGDVLNERWLQLEGKPGPRSYYRRLWRVCRRPPRCVDELADGHVVRAVLNDAILQRDSRESPLFAGLPVLAVEPGEGAKSLEGPGACSIFCGEKRDRGGVLFAFGAASSADLLGLPGELLRGIAITKVPTTLWRWGQLRLAPRPGSTSRRASTSWARFPNEGRLHLIARSQRCPRGVRGRRGGVINKGCSPTADPLRRLEAARGGGEPPALAGSFAGAARSGAIVEADEQETARDGGRELLFLGKPSGMRSKTAAGYGGICTAGSRDWVCAAARCRRNWFTSRGDFERLERVVTAHALPTRLGRRWRIRNSMLDDADKKVRAGGCASSCCAGSARRRRRPTCRRRWSRELHEVARRDFGLRISAGGSVFPVGARLRSSCPRRRHPNPNCPP